MSLDDSDEQTRSDAEYEVVINHEEQYSIWPVDQPIPEGWETVGFRGSKPDALDHIASVWTDITPLSVRRANGQR